MSNFYCDKCGAPILENKEGYYVRGCKHYPIDKVDLRDVSAGDILFSSEYGEVTVLEIQEKDNYPVKVAKRLQTSLIESYTFDGMRLHYAKYPTLFHNLEEHNNFFAKSFIRIPLRINFASDIGFKHPEQIVLFITPEEYTNIQDADRFFRENKYISSIVFNMGVVQTDTRMEANEVVLLRDRSFFYRGATGHCIIESENINIRSIRYEQ